MDPLTSQLQSLPACLSERTGSVGTHEISAAGEFVLYWMRTALRTDENPALDVAIEASNQLGLPLLVYQGLTENYPYASDRHHTFVLEAARDVQASFRQKGIAYALHIERPGARGPHLRTLAERAAVVVTEDMPTEPLRRWTEVLSRGLPCGILVVDTSCGVPMRLVGKAFDRAFAFRGATQKLYAQRLGAAPFQTELQNSFKSPPGLPFETVNLQVECIGDLVGQCEIDHSVGRIPDTPGGMVAGYRRWEDFKQNGLNRYHTRRNNPLTGGVSRLSAYLHYGMISPMRIAREAAAIRSDGSEKFLDELLIWRELAYAYCFYQRNHGRISTLPSWAIETLAEHERDPRPELLSWETMSRGKTGDLIWDSAQKSLLLHGELHNNVRMTWGKAILKWMPNAKSALERMIDLNHRYALDGRDPASYGGILWCLGQFDRPFSPEQKIFGTVRARSTEEHARRLDPIAYRRQVTRPLYASTPRVAVIGAGLSGLVCARTLVDHGFEVSVFEKSRGVSGRMSTRRIECDVSFDHGAQYFTARDERFRRYVESWIHDGLVQRWAEGIVVLDQGTVREEKNNAHRFVAVPGMNALGKHLAADLDVHLQIQVAAPQRVNQRWMLSTIDGDDLGKFDFVVVAVPSHQATTLLQNAPALAKASESCHMAPCWALMMSFPQSLDLPYAGAFVHNSPLSWIARNSSKAGRSAEPETWVAHASAEWSHAHIELRPDETLPLLLNEFWKATGATACVPEYSSAHRWRYAIPTNPLSVSCLFDSSLQIGACGDWCGGPRVEGAFLSGMAIAGRVLNSVSGPASAKVAGDKQWSLF